MVPPTAAYPAIVVAMAGSATGAVIMAVLIAANTKPMFLSFLKNVGVGDCILCMMFIVFNLI
jgi:hypothetical protein